MQELCRGMQGYLGFGVYFVTWVIGLTKGIIQDGR